MTAELQRGEVVLGRYQVIRLLGEGGMGVVYHVRDTKTQDPLALKLLIKADELDERERFLREIELVERLRSPFTVRLVDSGLMENDTPYMALEYVEGGTLADALSIRGALAPSMVRKIFIQVLEAVGEAHEWGIVHRDLKPHNIMLSGTDKQPMVKVLDFGMAGFEPGYQQLGDHKKITIHGEIRGTPNYMAPEQTRRFAEPCLETDIYALGLILLECLTGKRAVEGDTAEAILFKQVKEPIHIPPEISEGPFGSIIERATQKEISARFPKAESMLSFIRRITEDGSKLLDATFENRTTTTIDPVALLGEEEVARHRAELFDEPMSSKPEAPPTPTHFPSPFLPPPPEESGSNQLLVLVALVVFSLVALAIFVVLSA